MNGNRRVSKCAVTMINTLVTFTSETGNGRHYANNELQQRGFTVRNRFKSHWKTRQGDVFAGLKSFSFILYSFFFLFISTSPLSRSLGIVAIIFFLSLYFPPSSSTIGAVVDTINYDTRDRWKGGGGREARRTPFVFCRTNDMRPLHTSVRHFFFHPFAPLTPFHPLPVARHCPPFPSPRAPWRRAQN